MKSSESPFNKGWQELIILLCCLAPAAYLLLIWNRIPDQVAMHYNMAGEVDRYGPKTELWIPVLLLCLPIYLILSSLPILEKKEKQSPAWKAQLFRLRLLSQVCLSALSAVVVYSALATPFDPGRSITLLIALFFFGLGWLFSGKQVESRSFGFNMPWSGLSAENDQRTQQFGARIWMFGGLVGLLLFALIPKAYLILFMLVWILVLSTLPIGYSWRRHLHFKNSTPKNYEKR